MAKALYRKYRPKTLAEVVGQEQVTKTLANSLAQGKISHAYLFIGPRGTGKTSVARIFAHEINKFDYEIEDNYVDIIEIDGASNRGIDNIRELREKAAIAPTSGKYKVYIIDEVHMLTKEAFNALLKTLEEPPAHVIFIMATTDAYKVPVTITSRAQTYTFKLADPQVMFEHLKAVAKKEGIKIDDEALKIVVRRGGGSFRDSMSLLDQISTLSSDEITKDLVIAAMGLPEDDKITAILNNYNSGNIAENVNILKDLLSSAIKPETLAEEMIRNIIENPRPELMTLLSKLTEVKAPFAEAKLLIALTAGPTLNFSAQPNMQAPAKQATTSAPTPQPTSQSKPAPVSAPQSQPAPQPKPAPTPQPQTSIAPADFNWDSFLETVKSMNDAIHSQLKQCEYNINGSTLELYPLKKIAKTILSRDNNKHVLIEAAGGLKIAILNKEDRPSAATKDELLSKISGIMGGEVSNDGGDNPF